MKENFSAFKGACVAELIQMKRSRLFIVLAFIQAVTFLVLVSLFGLTGSMAPTALINNDKGPYSKIFIQNLENAHHSFHLMLVDKKTALDKLQHGQLVALISLPSDFSALISQGKNAQINVSVDNIDVDMTDDIQRAIPSAIVGFGNQMHLPNLRLHLQENDLLAHETGFIPYLVVSALVLDAFVLAGILSASAVAREFEQGTIRQIFVAPVNPLFPLLGRVLIADLIAFVGMLISTAIVIYGYHIPALHPPEVIASLALCIIIFGNVGAVLGLLLKKIHPVASLIFGLALPLYIDSGSLEPERFDGNLIWGIAHVSPLYYAIGTLEHGFHNFRVTPESINADFLALFGWAIVMIISAFYILKMKTIK